MKKKKQKQAPEQQHVQISEVHDKQALFDKKANDIKLLQHLRVWRDVADKPLLAFLHACGWELHQWIDFENSSDARITLAHLLRYVTACEITLTIRFGSLGVRMAPLIYSGEFPDRSRFLPICLNSKEDIASASQATRNPPLLGSRLFSWRNDSGLTLEEFSGKSGLDKEYINATEHGEDRYITIGDLMAYSRGAGVSFDLVIGNGTKIEKPFMLNEK